jgi:hypothetical protein
MLAARLKKEKAETSEMVSPRNYSTSLISQVSPLNPDGHPKRKGGGRKNIHKGSQVS